MEPTPYQPSGPVLPVLDPTPCCGPPSRLAEPSSVPPSPDQAVVVGTYATPVGQVPQVVSRLGWVDHKGAIQARWNINRMNYRVNPGLYALGQPDEQSPVLVSANYKFSFDRLRGALPGLSAWILVLDTDGVNVWCAAGKGTFGTQELINRVLVTGLDRVVTHRKLILPQLGAPGVAAHRVKKGCGFKAEFGPVRAEDLPAYLDQGTATPAMRRVTFGIRDRAAIIPVELVTALRIGLPLGLAFFILAGMGWPGGYTANLMGHGLHALSGLAAAILAGAVLTPLLLPWLPGRAFATKGFVIGTLTAGVHSAVWWSGTWSLAAGLEFVGFWAMGLSMVGYMAMNYTGASTYTSLSGVRREMRWAVPVEIGLLALGLIAWTSSRFFA